MNITKKNAGEIIKNARLDREHVDTYLKKWETEPYMFEYSIQDELLNKLFKENPNNNELLTVWQKCKLVDTCYSTNLKEGFWDVVLNIIHCPDFDSRVIEGDWELVPEISRVFSEKYGTKEAISFASKYCSRIAPDKFPVYDKYVRQMLCLIEEYHPFLSDSEMIKSIDKDYQIYKKVIDEFCQRKEFGESLDYKTADKYLWTWAKEIIQSEYRNGRIEYYRNRDCVNPHEKIKELLNEVFPRV